MIVKASWLLNEFVSTLDGYIRIDEDYLPKLTDFELEELYSEDFNYADEEEASGDIYYYYKGQLVLTHTIYGGDMEDFKFTELGKTMFKELLFNYITLLLNK
jgi:hypothetical protein